MWAQVGVLLYRCVGTGASLTVQMCGQGTGQAVCRSCPLTGLALSMARLACESVGVQKRPGRAVGVASHAAHHGVGVQGQTLATLGTLVGLGTRTHRTRPVALCQIVTVRNRNTSF